VKAMRNKLQQLTIEAVKTLKSNRWKGKGSKYDHEIVKNMRIRQKSSKQWMKWWERAIADGGRERLISSSTGQFLLVRTAPSRDWLNRGQPREGV